MAEAGKGKKQHHRCPPIPEGWTGKWTGPEATFNTSKDRRAWWDYIGRMKLLKPMPRTTR
jgi:hypothetical protein